MDERKTVTFMHNLLYLSCFIDLFAVSFIVPVLGAHLRSLGFSHSLIGITSTVYAGTQLFSGPIIGSWSDRYGRKVVLYLTLFVCSIAYCFLGVASSLTVILLIRVTLGLMKHTQTICKTLVADVFSKDKQIEIQGKLNAIAASGFMVGPIIGGHIVELDNGFQYICVTVSVLFFFNGIIVYLFFPDNIVSTTEKPSKKIEKPVNNHNTFKSNFYQIITDLFLVDWKSFWDVFLLKFILSVAVSLFFGCYYSFVEETFNITPKYIGYTISFQGLISAASGMQIKMFNKFYAEKSTASSYFLKLYHCFLILSITYITVYLSSNFYMFLFCLLLLSSSTSLIRIITTELLLIKSSENHRGSLMGASNSTSSSARMITPLITGVLQDSFKSSGVMVLASVLGLTGTVISYVLNSKSIVKEKTT